MHIKINGLERQKKKITVGLKNRVGRMSGNTQFIFFTPKLGQS